MKLERAFITPSPLGQNRQRLCGEVTYDTGNVKSDVYWFDVPESCASQLSTTGNAWFTALLPLAMTVGEPLHIPLPVDDQLYGNAAELMAIWRSWHSHLHSVALRCDRIEPQHPGGTRCASFFSGGVDSFFTALREEAHPGADRPDDLVLVWGLDIRLNSPDAFNRLRDRCASTASSLHRQLVDVATNIKDTRWRVTEWGAHSHGSALAAVGLSLGARWRKVSIASSHTYAELNPWGSHPLTDRLHSTAGTAFVHDGAGFTRVDKTRLVAQSDVALANLHVCWINADEQNCSRCSKCCRTMITLALLGATDRATTFDWRQYDVRRIKTIVSGTQSERDHLKEVQDLAGELGRADVASAIAASIRRSVRIARRRERIRRLLRRTQPLNRWFVAHASERPVLWRVAKALDRMGVA